MTRGFYNAVPVGPKGSTRTIVLFTSIRRPNLRTVLTQIIVLGMIFVGLASLSDNMYAIVLGTTGQLVPGN